MDHAMLACSQQSRRWTKVEEYRVVPMNAAVRPERTERRFENMYKTALESEAPGIQVAFKLCWCRVDS